MTQQKKFNTGTIHHCFLFWCMKFRARGGCLSSGQEAKFNECFRELVSISNNRKCLDPKFCNPNGIKDKQTDCNHTNKCTIYTEEVMLPSQHMIGP
jgi:hypothetical protein